jgi:hypothetical protein
MDVNKLVRMANQIAENLDYGPDKDKVVAATSDHLQRFWSPPMKQLIVEHSGRGETELSALAARAVAHLAERQRDAVRDVEQSAAHGVDQRLPQEVVLSVDK